MDKFINTHFRTETLTPGVRFLAGVNLILAFPFALFAIPTGVLLFPLIGLFFYYQTWRMFRDTIDCSDAIRYTEIGLFGLTVLLGVFVLGYYTNGPQSLDLGSYLMFSFIAIGFTNALFMLRMLHGVKTEEV